MRIKYKETYLAGGEVTQPGVCTLDARLLDDAVARLPVRHVVAAE